MVTRPCVFFSLYICTCLLKRGASANVWDSMIEDGGWNPTFSRTFNDWDVDIVETFL